MALVFWAIVGVVVAAIDAFFLAGLSFLLTRNAQRGRWLV
jgi:hypothetical protein